MLAGVVGVDFGAGVALPVVGVDFGAGVALPVVGVEVVVGAGVAGFEAVET